VDTRKWGPWTLSIDNFDNNNTNVVDSDNEYVLAGAADADQHADRTCVNNKESKCGVDEVHDVNLKVPKA
jgi:hypothetical protein